MPWCEPDPWCEPESPGDVDIPPLDEPFDDEYESEENAFSSSNGKVTNGSTPSADGEETFDDFIDTDVHGFPWMEYAAQIKKAVILDNVTEIGVNAFRECGNLTSVEVPLSVTSAAFSAQYTPNLSDIYYAGTTEQWNALNVTFVENLNPAVHCNNSNQNAFTVTFDPNGGSVSLNSAVLENGKIPSFIPQFSTEAGVFAQVSLYMPVRYGYQFQGWFTDKNSGEELTNNYTLTKDQNFYAHWTPFQGIEEQVWGDFRWSITKEGVLNVTGSGAIYEICPPTPVPGESPVNYAGVETPQTGASETEESQERQVIPWVVYGLQIKEAHFGEGITYVPSQAFRDCGFLESVSLPVTATSFSVSGADAPNLADIYFAGTQAQWNALYSYISGGIDPEIHCSDSVPQTFTVTFDANGGTVSPASKIVTNGEPYGELPTPVCNGFEFGGWYASADIRDDTRITAESIVSLTADQTLYALWCKGDDILCSITFDANGGTVVSPERTLVTNGQPYGELPTPTRTGYTFVGWYMAKTGGTQITKDTVVTLTEDHTLYAHWAANNYSVRVHLDSCGGDMEYDAVVTSGRSYGSNSFLNPMPTPRKRGYAFAGWYTESVGGTQITSDSIVAQDSNHTLYAQWTLDGYTVTFDPNGGSVQVNSALLSSGNIPSFAPEFSAGSGILATISVYAPVRYGYQFSGWFTARDGGEELTNDYVLTGDQTFYAHWEPFKGTEEQVWGDLRWFVSKDGILTVQGTGPICESSSFFESIIDHRLFTAIALPDNTKREVIPWTVYGIQIKSAVFAEGLTYIPAAAFADCENLESVSLPVTTTGFYLSGNTAPKVADIYFAGTKAQWGALYPDITDGIEPEIHCSDSESQTYTVTLDANGGSVSPDSVAVTCGGKYGELPTPTRTGYAFDGWFTAKTGGTQVAKDTIVTLTANQTLYARWTANGYTVTLNANGGSVSPDSVTVTYGGKYGELPTPTRTGYTFDGWFTAKTGGTQVTKDSVVSLTANQTLYAHWTANGYTVTLDANGGNVSPNSVTVTYGGKYDGLPTPTRTGHTFAGWYTAKTGGTQVTKDTAVTLTANQTLYARWTANGYTVTLDANGGNVSPNSIAVTYGGKYDGLPTPTRTGHTFAGWYTAKTGGTQVTKDTVVSLAANQTLYARWTANGYTVTLDANGGSVSPDSITVTYGGKYDNLPTPTWTGHTFAGWYTAKTGGTQVTKDTVVSLTANQTLYAHWTANSYKVTLDANGGSVSPDSVTVLYGGKYDSLPTPTRTGYAFAGWYTAKTGGTQITKDTAVTLTANQTLYARWTLIYTVYFNANGGTGAPSPQTKEENVPLTLSTFKPSKTYVLQYNATGGSVSPASKNVSCMFNNWNTAKNGEGTSYASGGNYTANADVTLYAQWTPPVAGALATPSRSGYDFAGWFTSATGGTQITASSTVAGNLTLYAHWTDPYNIGDETYSFPNYGDSDSPGGHCFGMSMTSAGYHNGLLDIGKFIGGNANTPLYSFDRTQTVMRPICHYQGLQGSVREKATVAGGLHYLYGIANIDSDWQEVVNYVRNHDYDNTGLLQIGLRKIEGNRISGHAINFLRYENVNGQDRIYAYDNNFPNQETYFYQDSSGRVWQKPQQTFSGAIDCIALRDCRTFFNSVGDFDVTHALYMPKDAATVQGFAYSYMDGDFSDEEYVMYEIPANQNRVIIIPNRDYADFIYMGTEYSFGEITDKTRGELRFVSLDDGAVSADSIFQIFEADSTTSAVTLDKTTLTLSVGESETLTATVIPNNATNKNMVWTSSNPSVATVVDGKITAIKIGVASITVATEDGAYSDTMEVQVYLPGDVNGSGKVDNEDLILLTRYRARWKVSIDMNAADVNGSGKVDNEDLILLTRYRARWKVTLLPGKVSSE